MQDLVFSGWRQILAFLAMAIVPTTLMPQTEEPLQPSEYRAFALICKQELSALGEKMVRPICVQVPPSKGTPKSLIKYLRSMNIPVRDGRACYPPGQLPLGSEIRIWEIKRGPGKQLAIKVETGNLTPEPGAHVGDLLRLGTYRLTKSDKQAWSIDRYDDEKSKN